MSIEVSNMEEDFGIQELFVSMTDKRGVIQSGNDVFVRVSGYEREELLGKPHNLIRHPDMPRSVFKLLWDTIQKDQPLMAYVKNRSVSGKYYWVFASVFPTETGYLSIRIKPTSPVFEIVKKVYEEVLLHEKQNRMQGSFEFLCDKIHSLGFKSYQDFMVHACRAELESRDQALSKIEQKDQFSRHARHDFGRNFGEMYRLCKVNADRFKSVLSDFHGHKKEILSFSEKIQRITSDAQEFEALIVNMNLSAYHLGNHGSSLSVVSSYFQKNSKEMIQSLKVFSESFTQLKKYLDELEFMLFSSRLQNEMLSFFGEEVCKLSLENEEREIPNLQGIQKDLDILIQQVRRYFSSNYEQCKKIGTELGFIRLKISKLVDLVQNLDVVRLGGRLESSHDKRVEEIFGIYVKEMLGFVSKTQTPMTNMKESLDSCLDFFASLETQMQSNLTMLLELEIRRDRVYYLEPLQNREKAV